MNFGAPCERRPGDERHSRVPAKADGTADIKSRVEARTASNCHAQDSDDFMKPTAILIAAVAGLASALLFAGLIYQSTAAISFALAAPIPIAIASLGWGSAAGFVAAFAAAGTIYAVTQSIPSALTLLVTMAAPMAVAGHLAGLARPSEVPDVTEERSLPLAGSLPSGERRRSPRDGTVRPVEHSGLDWYPITRILAAITVMAIAACCFLGWLLGFDPQGYVQPIVDALREGGGGAETADPDQLRELARLVIGMVPFVQPAILVLTLVVGLYLAAAATRISGRLPRPKDDLPATAGLPRLALPIFAVALAASLFLAGPLSLIADVVVGGLAMAFTLVGLAGLHRRSRGKPGRGIILFASYAAIFLLSFPIAVFAALGIFDTYRAGADTKPPSPA